MGEAARRKRAGTIYPTREQEQERAELIALLFEAMAQAGSDVSGITFLPRGGGEPIFLSAADAKRRPGRKPDA
jgi:hypothetical protein